MALKVEVATAHLIKHAEELCGDCVEAIQGPHTIVVLSDGLGSGVKAHILSSLTTKMAATMLRGGLEIAEVIDTLSKTLPVCDVRKLAYSTFSILRVDPDDEAYLVEYDNPPVFYGRGSTLFHLERYPKRYGERTVYESSFRLQDGDWLVMVSDGVLHAGIGGIWNLGWGWDRVGDYVRRVASYRDDAGSVAQELIDTVSKLYAGRPGDDATVVAMKVRKPRRLTVLAGPPIDRSNDSEIVEKFMSRPGKKAVCGGTSSIMVARELGRKINVNLASIRSGAPPTGYIEGIDLVTEGILTLTKVVEMLEKEPRPQRRELHYRSDGPARLLDMLLEADQVHFIVGRAMNPAHQSPDLPRELALKHKVVEDLGRKLKDLGKDIDIDLA